MTSRTVEAYVGIGSNLGNRLAHLRDAGALLEQRLGLQNCRRSRIYETEPVGPVTDQPAFLNAVIRLDVTQSADILLQTCLAIEAELGRVRGEPGGPRTVDLDLLLFGDIVRNDSPLQLPHPRLHTRGFVLAPLVELAPQHVHPKLGTTMQELMVALPKDGPQVRLTSHAW